MLCCSHGNEQRDSVPIFDVVGRGKIATTMARSTDDPKRAPIQRVSPIKNHDLVGEGFVSLTRWGIPEPPRSKAWTGAG